MNNTLTAVAGLKVGHYTDKAGMTGCTVIIAPDGAVAGVDVRGGAPGTRETDLMNPVNTVTSIHAVMIGGGSAYGLAAADGAMRWLEAQGIGFDVGAGVVPIATDAVMTKSEATKMAQLLAIYCNNEFGEKVNTKRVRELQIKIANEIRQLDQEPPDLNPAEEVATATLMHANS